MKPKAMCTILNVQFDLQNALQPSSFCFPCLVLADPLILVTKVLLGSQVPRASVCFKLLNACSTAAQPAELST